MKGYKGFDKDLKCKDFQFKVGETYEHDGEVKLCAKGFHFCESPLDVLGYYGPVDSKFAQVEGRDVSDERENDSKRVAKKLTIEAEITLPAIIDTGIKFILEKVDFTKATENKEDKKGATNSGDYGAATNSGNSGAATNSGYSGAATNSGKEGVAVSLGFESKAKASLGTWITLDEWKQDREGVYHRIDVKTFKIDGKKIKADIFYRLKNGKLVEDNC